MWEKVRLIWELFSLIIAALGLYRRVSNSTRTVFRLTRKWYIIDRIQVGCSLREWNGVECACANVEHGALVTYCLLI